MKNKGHLIQSVTPGSIADQLELRPGDRVLSIGGHEIGDVFDYEYYSRSEALVMLVRKADGEEWELEIEHNYEDLGITFDNGLMDEYRTCRNQCIFCFIDQMPPGMRETLYFKDDDSRLSFLQGNYITLTNMSDSDIQRIIRLKLFPINISVHTTNPELRCQMLHNRFAGDALRRIGELCAAGTPMNGQIVLCKGVNDGAELERTIRDLSGYLPYMESVSVVPVGLSKYREGLYPLEPIGPEDAAAVIDLVEAWQKKLYARHGTHFIHASDEFYLLAGRELPEAERYDGYIQLENGVGMLRLLDEEVDAALEDGADGLREGLRPCRTDSRWTELCQGTVDDQRTGMQVEEPRHLHGMPSRAVSIATGRLAYPYIRAQAEKVRERFPQLTVHIYPIDNHFFGEQITVTGLITGQDLVEQLRGKELGGRLLLSECMFRSGEEVFLDDLTREDLQSALQVPVNIVKSSGQDFVEALLHPVEDDRAVYEGYELKENRTI